MADGTRPLSPTSFGEAVEKLNDNRKPGRYVGHLTHDELLSEALGKLTTGLPARAPYCAPIHAPLSDPLFDLSPAMAEKVVRRANRRDF